MIRFPVQILPTGSGGVWGGTRRIVDLDIYASLHESENGIVSII